MIIYCKKKYRTCSASGGGARVSGVCRALGRIDSSVTRLDTCPSVDSGRDVGVIDSNVAHLRPRRAPRRPRCRHALRAVGCTAAGPSPATAVPAPPRTRHSGADPASRRPTCRRPSAHSLSNSLACVSTSTDRHRLARLSEQQREDDIPEEGDDVDKDWHEVRWHNRLAQQRRRQPDEVGGDLCTPHGTVRHHARVFRARVR